MTEDKLRMLRAVRFTATLEFQLDTATADAIRDRLGQSGLVIEDSPQGPRWSLGPR
mgnify:CR=1 FL=1